MSARDRFVSARRFGEIDALHRLGLEIAPCPVDLVFEYFGYREMLHQRDDVGKRFVKSEHIRIGRLIEARMHAVKDRVGGLVRDDVVRQTRVHRAASDVVARIVGGRVEIAEEQPNFLRAVIGIGLTQRVRMDGQLTYEFAVVEMVLGIAGGAPEHRSAQRLLDMADSLHRDRIDHLVVERWIAFGRLASVLRQ